MGSSVSKPLIGRTCVTHGQILDYQIEDGQLFVAFLRYDRQLDVVENPYLNLDPDPPVRSASEREYWLGWASDLLDEHGWPSAAELLRANL